MANEYALHELCLDAEDFNKLENSFHPHKKVKGIARLYNNRLPSFI